MRRLLNLFIALLLLLSLLAPYVSPKTVSLPSVLALGFEVWVALNMLCCLLWLLSKHKKRCLISLVALLLALPQISNVISVTPKRSVSGPMDTISVLTYNTKRMYNIAKPEKNKVLEYIKKQDADIVVLQEFETNKQSRRLTLQEVKDYLSYPYSYIDFKLYKGNRQFGLAVFSKYKLIDKTTLRYESAANGSDYCDVVLGADTFRLFNNHLQSYSLTADELEVGDMSGEELQKKATNVFSKLKRGYEYRPKQAKEVARAISESPYPVIVCGDFNDPPVSYTYHTISKGLTDVYLSAHKWSTGHTFVRNLFGVRIDYVLCSDRFTPIESKVERVDYSDHYPLLSTLGFRRSSSRRQEN